MDRKLSAIIKEEKLKDVFERDICTKLSFDTEIKVETVPAIDEHCTIIKEGKIKEEIFENDNVCPILSSANGINIETDLNINERCTQQTLSDYQEPTIHVKIEKVDPQTCGLCNQSFSDSYSLYKHNLIHLKVPLFRPKLFKCDDCPKIFWMKESLKIHKLAEYISNKQYRENYEDVDKPLRVCKICNKRFSYHAWLVHTRKEHGRGKWKREACFKVFDCEASLKRHVKSKHTDLVLHIIKVK